MNVDTMYVPRRRTRLRGNLSNDLKYLHECLGKPLPNHLASKRRVPVLLGLARKRKRRQLQPHEIQPVARKPYRKGGKRSSKSKKSASTSTSSPRADADNEDVLTADDLALARETAANANTEMAASLTARYINQAAGMTATSSDAVVVAMLAKQSSSSKGTSSGDAEGSRSDFLDPNETAEERGLRVRQMLSGVTSDDIAATRSEIVLPPPSTRRVPDYSNLRLATQDQIRVAKIWLSKGDATEFIRRVLLLFRPMFESHFAFTEFTEQATSNNNTSSIIINSNSEKIKKKQSPHLRQTRNTKNKKKKNNNNNNNNNEDVEYDYDYGSTDNDDDDVDDADEDVLMSSTGGGGGGGGILTLPMRTNITAGGAVISAPSPFEVMGDNVTYNLMNQLATVLCALGKANIAQTFLDTCFGYRITKRLSPVEKRRLHLTGRLDLMKVIAHKGDLQHNLRLLFYFIQFYHTLVDDNTNSTVGRFEGGGGEGSMTAQSILMVYEVLGWTARLQREADVLQHKPGLKAGINTVLNRNHSVRMRMGVTFAPGGLSKNIQRALERLRLPGSLPHSAVTMLMANQYAESRNPVRAIGKLFEIWVVQQEQAISAKTRRPIDATRGNGDIGVHEGEEEDRDDRDGDGDVISSKMMVVKNPQVIMSLAKCYMRMSTNRRCQRPHECVVKAMAMIDDYSHATLQLASCSSSSNDDVAIDASNVVVEKDSSSRTSVVEKRSENEQEGEEKGGISENHLAQVEVQYNRARGAHQSGVRHVAIQLYNRVLNTTRAALMEDDSNNIYNNNNNNNNNGNNSSRNNNNNNKMNMKRRSSSSEATIVRTFQRAAAFNLSRLLMEVGNLVMARDVTRTFLAA